VDETPGGGGSLIARIARAVGEDACPAPFDPRDDGHVDRLAAPLLHRFREQDDTAAFTLLVELTQRRVSRIAHQVTRQLAMAIDPEDLVAGFFARLFTDVRKRQPLVQHFLGLAHTSMRNDALNQLRQYKRAQARHTVWGEQRLIEKVADPSVQAEDNEQVAILRRFGTVFLAVLGQCFHELSERDRRVLLAREVDQLSYDDIAGTLSLPRNQVGMIVKRAREHLSQRVRATFARMGRQPDGSLQAERPARVARATRAGTAARPGVECDAPRGAAAGQDIP
jgi:RNA polymerase sigma factor (sigma-70 family)